MDYTRESTSDWSLYKDILEYCPKHLPKQIEKNDKLYRWKINNR